VRRTLNHGWGKQGSIKYFARKKGIIGERGKFYSRLTNYLKGKDLRFFLAEDLHDDLRGDLLRTGPYWTFASQGRQKGVLQKVLFTLK